MNNIVFMDRELKLSPRIKKMKERLLDSQPQIYCEDAELMTEAFKKYKAEPMVIRRAKAFENILLNRTIWITKEDLIVGNHVPEPRPKSWNIEPDIAVDWLEEEIFEGKPYFPDKRPASEDRLHISEEEKGKLRDIIDFWKGKTHRDRVLATLSKNETLAQEMEVVDANSWTFVGDGHFIPDTQKVFNKGLKGILEEVEQEINNLVLWNPEDLRKKPTLQAMQISLQAAIKFSRRYAELARNLADNEKDPQRKRELEVIALNCQNALADGPTSFWGALQVVYFLHLLILIEDQTYSISFGRLDQHLYPFYKKDITDGKLTKDKAVELIECLYCKLNEEKIAKL